MPIKTYKNTKITLLQNSKVMIYISIKYLKKLKILGKKFDCQNLFVRNGIRTHALMEDQKSHWLSMYHRARSVP